MASNYQPTKEETPYKMKSDPQSIKNKILELAEEYYGVQFGEEKFIPGETIIHNSGKLIGKEELKKGIEAILDGWWTEGRFAKQFERSLISYLGGVRQGVKHAILTTSGSSANLLAMYTLTSEELGEKRIKPNDEVITVAAAFPTTVNPIVLTGAVPVFVDIENIESGQYNIDTNYLEDAITDKTKAIFVAHTMGNPINLDEVVRIAKERNLWLIEDCCDALGSKYRNKKVSTYGDLSTFSFYPAHQITMGEGGAVVTNSPKINKLVRSWRSWGRDCWCEPGKDNTCGKRFEWEFGDLPYGYDHKNVYTHLGFNLKITDMQAAIGLAQLEKIEEFNKRRKQNFNELYGNLIKYEDHLILPQSLPHADPAWFGFLISVRGNAPFTRDELVLYLNKNKIGTRTLFTGNITKHPSIKNEAYKIIGDLKNTDATLYNTFWVGVQPNITDEKREYMSDTFESFFKSR